MYGEVCKTAPIEGLTNGKEITVTGKDIGAMCYNSSGVMFPTQVCISYTYYYPK